MKPHRALSGERPNGNAIAHRCIREASEPVVGGRVHIEIGLLGFHHQYTCARISAGDAPDDACEQPLDVRVTRRPDALEACVPVDEAPRTIGHQHVQVGV